MSDELPDFEDYGDEPASEESTDDEEQPAEMEISPEELVEENRELRDELARTRPLDEQNPLGLDPRVGVKDIAFDRAKPGAKVYVVACLASSLDAYEEEFPESPPLQDYAGNVLTRFSRDDAVFACVYVKDSLTSVDTNITAYPMPESRLTRFPAEQASMVGNATADFLRTPVPGDENSPSFGMPGRLSGAEPKEIPDDAERDEDGEAVLPDDSEASSGDAPAAEEMDLERALSVLSTYGYVDEAREVAADADVDEEEVYGL